MSIWDWEDTGMNTRTLDNYITGRWGENSVADEKMNPEFEAIEKALALATNGKMVDACAVIDDASLSEMALFKLAEGDSEGFRGVLFSLWGILKMGLTQEKSQ